MNSPDTEVEGVERIQSERFAMGLFRRSLGRAR